MLEDYASKKHETEWNKLIAQDGAEQFVAAPRTISKDGSEKVFTEQHNT